MNFETSILLFILQIVGFRLFAKMPAEQRHDYEVSLLKRLRRALCGLFGFAFMVVGGCLLLAQFGLVPPAVGTTAGVIGIFMLGALLLDVLHFIDHQPAQ